MNAFSTLVKGLAANVPDDTKLLGPSDIAHFDSTNFFHYQNLTDNIVDNASYRYRSFTPQADHLNVLYHRIASSVRDLHDAQLAIKEGFRDLDRAQGRFQAATDLLSTLR